MSDTPLSRRRCLTRVLGAGAMLAGLPPRVWAGPDNRPTRVAEELVKKLRQAKRTQALEIAGAALGKEASPTDVLSAVLQIGVEDIRPRPHGILHTVMMVHSSLALAQGADDTEAALLALWNLDDLKAAQQRDKDEWSDWTMSASTAGTKVDADQARKEFIAAMNAWNVERADRALINLFPQIKRADFFELIWPFAARCSSFIGHKMIYAVSLERATQVLPWTLSMARSLVQTLLVDRDTELWQANEKYAGEIAAHMKGQSTSSTLSMRLYNKLRRADSITARDVVIKELKNGGSVSDIWVALRLVASEVFHARSGRRSNTGRNALLPVHAVTVVHAFGYVSRATANRKLAARCLLEVTGRLPQMRSWLIQSTGLNPNSPSLETVLESPNDEILSAKHAAHLRTSLLRTAIEHHQHKYAAAVVEGAALTPPKLRPMILAPAAEYLANPNDPISDLHKQSLAALA